MVPRNGPRTAAFQPERFPCLNLRVGRFSNENAEVTAELSAYKIRWGETPNTNQTLSWVGSNTGGCTRQRHGIEEYLAPPKASVSGPYLAHEALFRAFQVQKLVARLGFESR